MIGLVDVLCRYCPIPVNDAVQTPSFFTLPLKNAADPYHLGYMCKYPPLDHPPSRVKTHPDSLFSPVSLPP